MRLTEPTTRCGLPRSPQQAWGAQGGDLPQPAASLGTARCSRARKPQLQPAAGLRASRTESCKMRSQLMQPRFRLPPLPPEFPTRLPMATRALRLIAAAGQNTAGFRTAPARRPPRAPIPSRQGLVPPRDPSWPAVQSCLATQRSAPRGSRRETGPSYQGSPWRRATLARPAFERSRAGPGASAWSGRSRGPRSQGRSQRPQG